MTVPALCLFMLCECVRAEITQGKLQMLPKRKKIMLCNFGIYFLLQQKSKKKTLKKTALQLQLVAERVPAHQQLSI